MTLNFTLTVPSNFQFNIPISSAAAIGPYSKAVGSPGTSNFAATSTPVISCAIPGKPLFGRIHLTDLLSKIYFFFHSLFYSSVNPSASQEQLRRAYFGLGEEKWMECIDGTFHDKGKYVFDRGLHGGTIEPGFIANMERAFEFAGQYLNRKIDAKWYLQLHKRTCGHFNGDSNIYLMGQERVGVFRNGGVGANFKGVYRMTDQALKEFKALEDELKRIYGDSYGLGVFLDRGPGALFLNYNSMTETQVRTLFNKFLNDFYQEVERGATDDQKLMAIAKIQQRLEWLHPVLDGTARTSTVLMNKLLTDYGFHPAILEYPHLSSTYGLQQWFEYLKDGLKKWEQKKVSLGK
jgi:hypothetical protein